MKEEKLREKVVSETDSKRSGIHTILRVSFKNHDIFKDGDTFLTKSAINHYTEEVIESVIIDRKAEMDVDNEVDQTLLHQFSCMGTTDKDDLIKQLLAIVGHHITPNTAAFFLDMNNWNLQAAVGSYFDINSSHKLPSMILTKDVAATKGEGITPNTKFVKSWYIQNNGNDLWPSGCYLQFTGGVCMSNQEKIPVVPIAPGCCTRLSIEMTSPSEPGIYQSKWRMCTSSGSYFGDVIWVILTVVENNELDGLTQQLSHLSDLGSPPRSQGSQVNPFNSFETFFQGPVQPSSPDKDSNMTW